MAVSKTIGGDNWDDAVRKLAQSRLQELQSEYWSEPLGEKDPMTCFRHEDLMLQCAKSIASRDCSSSDPKITAGRISLVANAVATVGLMTGSLPPVPDSRVRRMVERILKDNPRFG